jgi:hypothetical protein
MSLVVKALLSLCVALFSLSAGAQELNILVLGQSIAGNCNVQPYSAYPEVYQRDHCGGIMPAQDPLVWSDCEGGSIWIALGQRLVERKVADRVIFLPLGVQAQIMEWLPEGRAWQKLDEALTIADEQDITFDYVLWHQDSLDEGMNKFDYQNIVNKTIKYVNGRVKVKKWLVAQNLRCHDDPLDSVSMTKGSFSEISFNRYLGPSTKTLTKEYRIDNCRLNAKGQEELAERWFHSIVSAEKQYQKIKSESLLNLFQ